MASQRELPMDDTDSTGPNTLGQFTFPNPDQKIEFTGERYVSGVAGPIQHEHFHRYLFAAPYCRDRSVLDIACGEGYGCHVLAQVASSVVGVDIDAEAVRYAQDQYASSTLRFETGDATAIPLASGSVDVVTSFETIEHFADHERFLAEVARVLRPGGLVIISSPNRPIYSEESNYNNPFHVRELDREEFRRALQSRFANVALFEQRFIDGSVITAEPVQRTRIEGFDSSDGLAYSHQSGVPSPQYFVAVASTQALPEIASSLLFSGAYIGGLHNTIERLNKRVDEKDAEIATLRSRLSRTETHVAGLRAALEQWRAEASGAEGEVDTATTPQPMIAVTQPAKRRHRSSLRRISEFWGRLHAKREFDAAYYVRNNPDVAAAGVDPFRHYLRTGWIEGRDPTPTFSTSFYLESHPDVKSSGTNPFVHYVSKGRAEGRQPAALATIDDAPYVPVPLLEAAALTQKSARVIAFYLPQFHAIPENDRWWGKGFTEWTNVRAAEPQFKGHYQPHVPGELGYYDLLDPAVQRRQIELAKIYGVEGFCFYFYWFAGKRLLEKPVENWLNDKSLDLPFCLCWANENWTRRWDGLEQEILIDQRHSPEDDLAFIAEAAPYLRDPRYIRIDGKPLLLVYRPNALPSAKQTAQRWRAWCAENGVGEIHLAYTQSFEQVDPSVYGFDSAIEFPPNRSQPPDVTQAVTPLREDFSAKVYDWRVFKERSEGYRDPGYTLYRTVCPGWDNTARRKSAGTVFVNNTPARYRDWLVDAIRDTKKRFARPDQRLIFVNAWNEWAEGAHLEPDARFGYAWLQATREALEGQAASRPAGKRRVVLVSHDAHPHGAQYLAMHMARTFSELGFDTDMIVLGGGKLLPLFAEVATVHSIDLDAQSEAAVVRKLQELRDNGAEIAFANTTVSGLLVPLLKRVGFTTVSLVHELPGVLKDYKLHDHASAIAEHADKVVFPAEMVRDGFETFVGRVTKQGVIRPQGLLRRNPFKGRHHEAHRAVCERHGLPLTTKLVLSVAFVDERKGADLFVEAAEKVLTAHPNVAFIWVGHSDRQMQARVEALLKAKKLAGRVMFVGFVAEPMDYYAAASVYALPSREDPFPNVVLESAEVDVPVVAFDGATGAGDFIVERGGRLARAFDAGDFAANISDVLSSSPPATCGPVGSLRQYLMDILHVSAGFHRVSVVVPNYNYAKYLSTRLASVVGQTFPIYDLIVLDDASTDSSVETINALLAENPGIDSELIVNTSNSGSVFRQWKKGLARCRGDLVWIAEADDLAEPSFLSRLVSAFEDPATVLAFSQSRQIDGNGKELSPDYLDYTKDISRAWHADYTRPGPVEIAEALAVKNTIPNVSAVLFRRDALDRAVNALGDSLFEYRVAGDWLIYMQTLVQGNVSFVASALNSHRRHAASVTKSGMAGKHLEEVANAQEFARTHASVSDATRRKADAWLEHVRRYLKLT